jgi:hypothetical protein
LDARYFATYLTETKKISNVKWTILGKLTNLTDFNAELLAQSLPCQSKLLQSFQTTVNKIQLRLIDEQSIASAGMWWFACQIFG